MDDAPQSYKFIFDTNFDVHTWLQISDCQVSSVEIERVCNSAHVAVLETAAIGVPPSGGGPEQLLIVAVLKGEEGASSVPAEDLKKVFNATIQSKLNPLFKVHITRFKPMLVVIMRIDVGLINFQPILIN